MDLEGLIALLAGIRTGAIRCLAVDSATPSAFAHELLNAMPYAFLDDAPLEERRARAVSMRGMVPDKLLGEAGRLDPVAIAELRDECRPDVRDEHELHDLLCGLIVLPMEMQQIHWPLFFERLQAHGRATVANHAGRQYMVAAERVQHLRLLWPEMVIEQPVSCPAELKELIFGDVVRKTVQGWMALLGPVTSRALGETLGLEPASIWAAMLVMEMQGTILRGVFEGGPVTRDEDVEWCERRLLQRIHKRTLAGLRKQIEPVTPAIYMQWLLRWQRAAPRAQLSGEAGVLEAIRLLEGFEAPAIEWERTLLPQRVSGYDPRWLDTLCLEGVVGWGRISPHPAFATHGSDFSAPKRVVPTSMAPVTFFLREDALWMDRCLAQRAIPEPALQACLSELAWQTRAHLAQHGAVFAGDLIRGLGLPAEQVNRALWELVAAGLVTADGFDSLRVLIDPRRKAAFQGGLKRARNTVGRWSLLNPSAGVAESAGAQAERREAEVESACWMLLRRYGVVFRDVLERETTIPRWRELLGMFRRLEARGNVRGGRFIHGFGGEQFAVPEAVASLREARLHSSDEPVTVAAADPLNLAGVVVPGERPAAVPGKTVTFLAGAVRVEETSLVNAV
jgi:ATP-dependent Lhr-like helicase